MRPAFKMMAIAALWLGAAPVHAAEDPNATFYASHPVTVYVGFGPGGAPASMRRLCRTTSVASCPVIPPFRCSTCPEPAASS
jgi:hypothetical protein